MLKLETEGTEKTEMQSSKAPATATAAAAACGEGSRVSREIPSGDLVNDGSREPARVVRLGIA